MDYHYKGEENAIISIRIISSFETFTNPIEAFQKLVKGCCIPTTFSPLIMAGQYHDQKLEVDGRGEPIKILE